MSISGNEETNVAISIPKEPTEVIQQKNAVDALLASINLKELDDKLKSDNIPTDSEYLIEFLLQQYGTNKSEVNRQLKESTSTEESIDIINNMFRVPLLYIEDDKLKANFSSGFGIYQNCLRSYMPKLNVFLRYFVSSYVNNFQRQYIPYFRSMFLSVEVPLDDYVISLRNTEVQESNGLFDGITKTICGIFRSVEDQILQMQQQFLNGPLAQVIAPMFDVAIGTINGFRDTILGGPVCGGGAAALGQGINVTIGNFVLGILNSMEGILGETLHIFLQGTIERIFGLPHVESFALP